ncbi:MAG TPA: ribbon-helix-helix protein, CopG family [Candidatus Obscuribacterales bacterium]
MADKKTMTLNLTEQEMAALEELAAKKDVSKTAVIRQALKLYQLVDSRLSQGERMFFENGDRKEKSELAVL